MAQESPEGLRRLVGFMTRRVDDAQDVKRFRLVRLDRHCPLSEGQGFVQALKAAHLLRLLGIGDRQRPFALRGRHSSDHVLEKDCAALQEEERARGWAW